MSLHGDNKRLIQESLASVYLRHSSTISIEMAEYHLTHLKRLHQAFQGDLLLPLILGEIGLFNLRGLDLAKIEPRKKNDNPLTQYVSKQLCNTYSVSLALGLPRETARRKVLKLIEMGFLKKSGARGLQVTDKAVLDFVPEFNFDSYRLFLEANERINKLVSQKK